MGCPTFRPFGVLGRARRRIVVVVSAMSTSFYEPTYPGFIETDFTIRQDDVRYLPGLCELQGPAEWPAEQQIDLIWF